MSINSLKDIQFLKRIGLIVSQVLKEMRIAARPGMNTRDLDLIGRLLEKKELVRLQNYLIIFPGQLVFLSMKRLHMGFRLIVY